MRPNYLSRRHGFESRKHWSDNALRKKGRIRIERSKAADDAIIKEYEERQSKTYDKPIVFLADNLS